MSCDFAHDDAAYVLGALSPADRLAFERHLETCDACTRSVRSLAGMPGLLDRVDASVLENPPDDPPLPSTLLPALNRAVEDRRRRRHSSVGPSTGCGAKESLGASRCSNSSSVTVLRPGRVTGAGT